MPPRRAHRRARPPHCAWRRARPPRRPRRRACPFIAHVAVRVLHLVYTPAHVLHVPHVAAYLPRGVHGAEHVAHIVHEGVHDSRFAHAPRHVAVHLPSVVVHGSGFVLAAAHVPRVCRIAAHVPRRTHFNKIMLVPCKTGRSLAKMRSLPLTDQSGFKSRSVRSLSSAVGSYILAHNAHSTAFIMEAPIIGYYRSYSTPPDINHYRDSSKVLQEAKAPHFGCEENSCC
ncbi:hypothetical protein B0H10DRAFT_2057934 [Mycena sp. CBHHK59/15]|nr:hypothetical protein B0H10DRAFT_2091672 [Mycena sp. CBHHK59/15]KAJ6611067.1 hypothetical protein B0H10DRAFT_2057934 [Mycena sp. CBHHK59/15]